MGGRLTTTTTHLAPVPKLQAGTRRPRKEPPHALRASKLQGTYYTLTPSAPWAFAPSRSKHKMRLGTASPGSSLNSTARVKPRHSLDDASLPLPVTWPSGESDICISIPHVRTSLIFTSIYHLESNELWQGEQQRRSLRRFLTVLAHFCLGRIMRGRVCIEKVSGPESQWQGLMPSLMPLERVLFPLPCLRHVRLSTRSLGLLLLCVGHGRHLGVGLCFVQHPGC